MHKIPLRTKPRPLEVTQIAYQEAREVCVVTVETHTPMQLSDLLTDVHSTLKIEFACHSYDKPSTIIYNQHHTLAALHLKIATETEYICVLVAGLSGVAVLTDINEQVDTLLRKRGIIIDKTRMEVSAIRDNHLRIEARQSVRSGPAYGQTFIMRLVENRLVYVKRLG